MCVYHSLAILFHVVTSATYPTSFLLFSLLSPGTPGAAPYGGCSLHFNQVEANMKLRSGTLVTTFSLVHNQIN